MNIAADCTGPRERSFQTHTSSSGVTGSRKIIQNFLFWVTFGLGALSGWHRYDSAFAPAIVLPRPILPLGFQVASSTYAVTLTE